MDLFKEEDREMNGYQRVYVLYNMYIYVLYRLVTNCFEIVDLFERLQYSDRQLLKTIIT